MFAKLRKLFSPTREKTDKPPSTQAPSASGVEVTSSYIDGHWNFNTCANLLAAQIKAHKQARKRRTPVPERKPYSLVPGGHHETVAWIYEPSSPETLERLFAVRDEVARRRNARFVRDFNLARTLPEPGCGKESATTPSTDAGIPIEDQGKGESHEITQDDSADTSEDDGASIISGCSYTSSSSEYSSDSSDSDESFGDRAVGGNNRHHPVTTPGELEEFVKAWSENATSSSSVAPAPSSGPPLRRNGKYHYGTAAAARRLQYMKSYLSLREGCRPINIFLLLIHYRRAAACDAARRNPAFLRAALDIDWDGILSELPPPRHKNDSLHMYNKHVIRTWLDCDGYIFTEPDRNGEPVVVLEDAESAELSWPELLAREDLEGPGKRRYDYRVYNRRLWRRLNGFEKGNLHGKRKWRKPGSSNLRLALPAPYDA